MCSHWGVRNAPRAFGDNSRRRRLYAALPPPEPPSTLTSPLRPVVAYAGAEGLPVYSLPQATARVLTQLSLHQKVYRYKVTQDYAYVKVEASGVLGWVDNTQLLRRLPSRAKRPPVARPEQAKPAPTPPVTPEAPAEATPPPLVTAPPTEVPVTEAPPPATAPTAPPVTVPAAQEPATVDTPAPPPSSPPAVLSPPAPPPVVTPTPPGLPRGKRPAAAIFDPF